MVPRIQESNLRALTYSGVSRENAKYISLSLFFPFFFFFLCSFVFGEKKKNYNTLLFLTFIKSSFLLFLGGKKTRHLMKLSCTLTWCGLIHNFYLISQGKTPTL